MGLFKSFCSMLSNFSIARLFSYTRLLESSLVEKELEYRKREEEAWARHQEQIAFLNDQLLYLRSDLKAERELSRIDHEGLLDRALAKNGIRPIHFQEEPKKDPTPKQMKPEFEVALEEAEANHRAAKNTEMKFKEMADAARLAASQGR